MLLLHLLINFMFAARFDPRRADESPRISDSVRAEQNPAVKHDTEGLSAITTVIDEESEERILLRNNQGNATKRKIEDETYKQKKPKKKAAKLSEAKHVALSNFSDHESAELLVEKEKERTQVHQLHQKESKTEKNKGDIDGQVDSKHSKIFHRFQQTMKLKEYRNLPKLDKSGEEETDHKYLEKESERYDLISLPQPELPEDKILSSLVTLNQKIDWLAKPVYYRTKDTLPFQKLGLHPCLLNNILQEFGYKEAFNVQISVIRTLQADQKKNETSNIIPGDLLANAPTGSGKTLGYCIPVVQAILGRRVPAIRCIILAPTKPLVSQVYSTLNRLCKGMSLNVMELRNDTVDNEAIMLTDYASPNYPDIIVSTPGRLLEHLNANRLRLQYLRFLVVDEADRILHSTSFNWCSPLFQQINSDRSKSYCKQGKSLSALSLGVLPCQKLVFSATLTTDAEKLSHLQLYKPRLLVVNDQGVESGECGSSELYQLPPLLDELSLTLSNDDGVEFFKPLILFKLLTEYVYQAPVSEIYVPFKKNVLVFIRSNEASARMEKLLSLLATAFDEDLRVKAVNALLDPVTREQRFHDFTENKIDVLVATDLMARGMDLPNITHVINYDLPGSTREYVHRVGRTARANKFGIATSFVLGEGDRQWLRRLTQSGVINRNGKSVNEIPIAEDHKEGLETLHQHDHGNESRIPAFVLSLTEPAKLIYHKALEDLGYEVNRRKI